MSKTSSFSFALSKKNYLVIVIGLVVITLGYILMSGGGSPDPNTFNADELFSARRITLAPITILIGYGIVGYGIMLRPKN
ncbi:MAG: DUF3098 domain-containing protein [Flavobacteriales bacterium]|jgi:hypothetical protein